MDIFAKFMGLFIYVLIPYIYGQGRMKVGKGREILVTVSMSSKPS